MVSDTRCKNVFGNGRIDAQKHRSELIIFGQVFRDGNLVDIPQIGVDFVLVVLHQPLCQQSLEGRPVMFVELVGLSRWQILFRDAPVFDFGRELGRKLPAIKIQAVIAVKQNDGRLWSQSIILQIPAAVAFQEFSTQGSIAFVLEIKFHRVETIGHPVVGVFFRHGLDLRKGQAEHLRDFFGLHFDFLEWTPVGHLEEAAPALDVLVLIWKGEELLHGIARTFRDIDIHLFHHFPRRIEIIRLAKAHHTARGWIEFSGTIVLDGSASLDQQIVIVIWCLTFFAVFVSNYYVRCPVP
mmetsp:Transcript_14945/g.37635  ORF Transcript_14945/g.37635 Transcript_14945/m.37635 type:complete len:296 (-) Transcript_14945:377-1264(-)